MVEFIGFPKIPRYSRDCVVSEKIDGTNGCIAFEENGGFFIGSRSRWITISNDNHGFARWAMENVDELRKLGPGRHFGEWWGQGIQRGYGLKEKRFSLFNLKKWSDPAIRPACCHVVPIWWEGMFPPPVDEILEAMRVRGSAAAPGYMNPEGIVIFHSTGNLLFKKTLKNDEGGKESGHQGN